MTEQSNGNPQNPEGSIIIPELVRFPGDEFGGDPADINLLHRECKLLSMDTREGRAEAADAVNKMSAFLDELGYPAGLAANQLGIDANVILCPQPPDGKTRKVYINTKITRITQERVLRREACLSGKTVNGETVCYDIERPAGLEIEFMDAEGNPETQTLKGPLADIMWQEIDHVYGKTIDSTKGTIPDSRRLLKGPEEFSPLAREYKTQYPVPENPTWIPYSEYLNN